MGNRVDLTGQVFERLTVVRFSHCAKGHHAQWLCKCSCGKDRTVSLSNLRSGKTVSCGCKNRDDVIERNTTHGMAKSSSYVSWKTMKTRCSAAHRPSFKNYGGRGIKICDRWASFENFLEDMGERLEGTTLDRINNNGDYEPSNCRWATNSQQARNTRKAKKIAYGDKLLDVYDWAVETGLPVSNIKYRLKAGWSIEQTLTTPILSGNQSGYYYTTRPISIFLWLLVCVYTLFNSSANALPSICGDKFSNDGSGGVAGACSAGYIDAASGIGCDLLCATPDQDNDLYATTGLTTMGSVAGIPSGADCDDQDPTIWPGRTTTKGCSAGNFRTCQNSGSYNACAALSTFGADICVNRYFIDPVSGNNANVGTYASPWRDQRMYADNDVNPAGHHVPVPGDCFIYKAGTNSTAGVLHGVTSGIVIEGNNCTLANPCRILALPGTRPIFDYPGTSGTPINPLYIKDSDYWFVEKLEVKGNYCNANGFNPNAGCVTLDRSNNVTFINLLVHDNDGAKDNNMSGILIGTVSNTKIFTSVFWDNYDHANPIAMNNSNYESYHDVNTLVVGSTFIYTNPVSVQAMLFKAPKHSDPANSQLVIGNTFQGGTDGVSASGPNHTIRFNRFDTNIYHYSSFDLGGTTYQTGTKVISDNTMTNGRFAYIRPTKQYNLNGTSAADKCSGNITLTNWVFERNLVVDSRPSYGQDFEFVGLNNYDADSQYTDVVSGGKLRFNSNCEYNGSTALVYSLYRSNDGNTTCAGRGNLGTVYASFAAWQSAPLLRDNNSFNVNPVLDTSGRATAAQCLTYGARHLSDAPVPTPTPTPTPTATPTATPTPPTPTPTPTGTPTPTPTPPTPTPTPVPTPTITPTSAPTPTITPTPNTPTPTPTPSGTPTATPTKKPKPQRGGGGHPRH